MKKFLFSAVVLSVALASGTAYAQGTPVQGTPAPASTTTTAPAQSDTTKVKMTEDEAKVKTEDGKMKADAKARR